MYYSYVISLINHVFLICIIHMLFYYYQSCSINMYDSYVISLINNVLLIGTIHMLLDLLIMYH